MQFSPDGASLAFGSERSGFHEIWVSNADGKNAMQLTHFGGPVHGGPYWSPDGQWISFGSQAGGSSARIHHPRPGGAAEATNRPANGCHGRSVDTGRAVDLFRDCGQLWKIPAEGGSPVQITRNGGGFLRNPSTAASFSMPRMEDPERSPLWSVPAEGGEEHEVLPEVFPTTSSFERTGSFSSQVRKNRPYGLIDSWIASCRS